MAEVVAEAKRRLWTPEGAEALAYLWRRGLSDETIRAARLGIVTRGRPGVPAGLLIPWFSGSELAMVNVRRPEGSHLKYRAVAGSRRGGIYPGREAIRPGMPLVIVEGELDALLLGQILAGLAVVVTLGSASARPGPGILGPMLAASVWYIATDADAAGDRAASGWPARGRRVRPPGGFKDWTEAAGSPEGAQGCGMNLRRWLSAILSSDPSPPLFTCEELARWRWGPALVTRPRLHRGRAEKLCRRIC